MTHVLIRRQFIECMVEHLYSYTARTERSPLKTSMSERQRFSGITDDAADFDMLHQHWGVGDMCLATCLPVRMYGSAQSGAWVAHILQHRLSEFTIRLHAAT